MKAKENYKKQIKMKVVLRVTCRLSKKVKWESSIAKTASTDKKTRRRLIKNNRRKGSRKRKRNSNLRTTRLTNHYWIMNRKEDATKGPEGSFSLKRLFLLQFWGLVFG